MTELNEIELILLKRLTTKYPSLKFHIPHLRVSERKATGVGMYVNFEYVNFEQTFEDLNSSFSGEENIEIPSLEFGLGYVIDITEGEIKYIEFITYGENWDGKFDGFKIVETD